MTTFTIDNENNITAFSSREEGETAAITEVQYFGSGKDFAKLAAGWPATRLVEIWNGLTGVTPVKRFTDRKKAIGRIWKAVQRLQAPVTAGVAPKAAQDAPKPEKAAKGSQKKEAAAVARDGSKKAIVLDLLRRPSGATLKEIMAVTDWQAHSVRGFISGMVAKKLFLKVESIKAEGGGRSYRIAGPAGH